MNIQYEVKAEDGGEKNFHSPFSEAIQYVCMYVYIMF
jgi:hypothetical protein